MVVARHNSGAEYRGTSDQDGRFSIAVAPGAFTVHFPAVDGLIGSPASIPVTVAESESVDLQEVGYDTGIR